MDVYCCCLEKAVITKDTKAECKSNLFKNKRDWNGGLQQVFIYTKQN